MKWPKDDNQDGGQKHGDQETDHDLEKQQTQQDDDGQQKYK